MMKYKVVIAMLGISLAVSSCGHPAPAERGEPIPDEIYEAQADPQEETAAETEKTVGERAASESAGSVLDHMASSFGQPTGSEGASEDAEEAPEYVLVSAEDIGGDAEYVLLPPSDPEEAPLGVTVESQTGNNNAGQTGTKAGSNDSILNEILSDGSNVQDASQAAQGSQGSSGGGNGGGSSSQASQPAAPAQPSQPAKKGNGSRNSSPRVLAVSAPGTDAQSGGPAVLDVSNASQGYVMVNYSGNMGNVRFKSVGPDGRSCTYVVSARGSYQAFPLTGGNGNYSFTVYEEAPGSGGLYAAIISKSMGVSLADGFLPYLYPNMYCNFTAGSACVAKAAELAKPCDTDLQVIENVYHYCVNNITYDDAKAASVQSGYAPTPDETLASGRGICFDYASLMTAMLRSQGIPTRLEVGYVGNLYHAWVSCYITGTGWIDGVIQFDGANWTLMDPTTAHGSSSGSVQSLKASPGYDVRFLY